MKNAAWLISLLAYALVTVPIPAGANMDGLKESINKFAYGQVVTVSATNIVISEYDINTDEDIEVTYLIDNKTRYRNVGAFDEFVNGDAVEIMYKEVKGKKIAQKIIKEDISQTSENFDFKLDDNEDLGGGG